MQERIQLVIISFNLKDILEERGRLAQLDKVRNMVTKMRTAPRNEIPDVLKSLAPELRDVMGMDTVPPEFIGHVAKIVVEIEEELVQLDARVAAATVQTGTVGTCKMDAKVKKV